VSSAVANVPHTQGITFDYFALTIPQITERVLKKVRRGGLIPGCLVWKVEFAEDYTHLNVNAYSPGVYCLPGKRGCPNCGKNLVTRPHEHDRQTCHIRCPDCDYVYEWFVPRYMAHSFIRI